MSLVEKYLNFNNNNNDFTNLIDDNKIISILAYQNSLKGYVCNPEEININIINKLKDYIDENYKRINIENGDINYYLEHINIFSKIKFNQIIRKLDLDQIISMMDYGKQDKKKWKEFMNEYYKYVNDKIINGQYQIVKFNEKFNEKLHTNKLHLNELLDDLWTNISFDNLINFTSTINRMKYFGQKVELFESLIETKFDSKENIKKLIQYLNDNFIEENLNDNKGIENEDINFSDESQEKNKKFNFRFVIENLKSNGFLLFEEYYSELKMRYRQQINIEYVKKDKKLVNYFMLIVSEKDTNSVNRYVNEMLIKIRDYIYDLEDSYYNNENYKKIKICLKSEKYQKLDISTIKRELYNFTIFKYSFGDSFGSEIVSKFKPTEKIEPYLDIYRSYYRTRYPDRDVEFDIFNSTIVVENSYQNKLYYIHMALIQYIVLDKIINNIDGITIMEISEQTEIPINLLQDSINSLIKIKLIGRTKGETIDKMKLVSNEEFSYEKNKISISSMILKDKNKTKEEKPKEFLHDRSMIVLCNIIDWVKKNKYFSFDTITDSIKYKIPFTITEELLEKAIHDSIEKGYIKKISIPNPNGIGEQIMFQYESL
jgi:hypothetical protein